MADSESPTGQDWRLPQASRPPLVGELVARIDEAVATARASEAAVITVGAAALDAAEQAKRAADLAAAANASADAAWRRIEADLAVGPSENGRAHGGPNGQSGDAAIGDFSARADRLAERLRRLQRLPLGA